jgi:hypothetical protein
VQAVTVDAAGERLALLVRHLGRRNWTVLHWLDLATGHRRSWDWTAVSWEDEIELVGVHDGAMLLHHDRDGRRDGTAPTMRWTPGSAPEPMPWRVLEIDSYSGCMVLRDRTGTALTGPGVDRGVVAGDQLRLPPGARLVCRVGGHRLKVTDRAGGEVREIVLPLDAWLRGRPVWESPHTLVLPLAHGDRLGCDAVRIDLVDGTYERIRLGPWAGHRGFTLVHPLIRG